MLTTAAGVPSTFNSSRPNWFRASKSMGTTKARTSGSLPASDGLWRGYGRLARSIGLPEQLGKIRDLQRLTHNVARIVHMKLTNRFRGLYELDVSSSTLTRLFPTNPVVWHEIRAVWPLWVHRTNRHWEIMCQGGNVYAYGRHHLSSCVKGRICVYEIDWQPILGPVLRPHSLQIGFVHA